MVRSFAVAAILSCLAAPAWAQSQPRSAATAPLAKLQAPKIKTATAPLAPASNGRCQICVIPAIGDRFVVQKVGLMVFGNEHTEVPIDAWGLDELVVARVRAAAGPATSVRRIAYTKSAFEPYENPPARLFRNSRNDLTALLQQITANASCERYFVFTKLTGQLDGTNQTLRGIGVVNHGTGILSNTFLVANFHLTVFDGQSFAETENRFANLGSALAASLRLTRDPLTVLDNASFPEPATGAANSSTLRDHTRALLTAKLDETLSAYLGRE